MAAASGAQAQSSCRVVTRTAQEGLTPEGAIELLKGGNARFVAGQSVNCDFRKQVKDTAEGQYPFAAIVGCMDSRAPPELVFDQHIGSIFVVRVAGNVIDTDVLGSLEYACGHAGSKAIVVMGHEGCGGVKSAIDAAAKPVKGGEGGHAAGNLTTLLNRIQPAVRQTTVAGARTSNNAAFVDAVVRNNALMSASLILARSPVLNQLVHDHKIVLAVAVDNLHTGKVEFIRDKTPALPVKAGQTPAHPPKH